MSEAAKNTKIELVTEAIETLVKTCVAGQAPNITGDAARRQFELVQEARIALADSLRVLLQPTLRVLDNPSLPPAEKIPYGGQGIDGMNLA